MTAKSDIQKLKELLESSDLLDAMDHFMIKKLDTESLGINNECI